MTTRLAQNDDTLPVARVRIDQNGFCRVDLRCDETSGLDVVSMEEVVETVYRVCDGEKFPVLVDARGVNGLVSPGASAYIRRAPKLLAIKKAQAIVVNSFTDKIGANLRSWFSKSSSPLKMFNDEVRAIQWLAQFK